MVLSESAATENSVELEGTQMFKVLSFLKDEAGATAIEYCLIASGISIVIIASVNAIGATLETTFGGVSTQLK